MKIEFELQKEDVQKALQEGFELYLMNVSKENEVWNLMEKAVANGIQKLISAENFTETIKEVFCNFIEVNKEEAAEQKEK